jgi:hypothetical protein
MTLPESFPPPAAAHNDEHTAATGRARPTVNPPACRPGSRREKDARYERFARTIRSSWPTSSRIVW